MSAFDYGLRALAYASTTASVLLVLYLIWLGRK